MRVEKALLDAITMLLDNITILIVKHHYSIVSIMQHIIEKLLWICSKLVNFIARRKLPNEIGNGQGRLTRQLFNIQMTTVNALATSSSSKSNMKKGRRTNLYSPGST